MKKFLLGVADILGYLWRLAPERLRDGVVTGLLVLDSRHSDPAEGLKRVFRARDQLDLVTAERAMAFGGGVHPKHRLTHYHDFFVERIKDGDRVIDVGCGVGAVARSVALARPGATVSGVDYDKPRLAQARAVDNPPNLTFCEADATKSVPDGPWDVVILSNVLEHIVDRPGLLRQLQQVTGAERFLIRVPLFERDWQMAMRRELGVNYYSDNDHKIEHTLKDFREEMAEAGLEPVEILTLWGEIWSENRRRRSAAASAV